MRGGVQILGGSLAGRVRLVDLIVLHGAIGMCMVLGCS
jgi:hypothetical protein